MNEGEGIRQRPENFSARLNELKVMYHDSSRTEEYRALLDTYERAEKGDMPDDLDLALWVPQDFADLRARHQQEIQGGDL